MRSGNALVRAALDGPRGCCGWWRGLRRGETSLEVLAVDGPGEEALDDEEALWLSVWATVRCNGIK